MAKLSAFRRNSAVLAEGDWVKVGPDFDDLEIRTRGFTDDYYDAQSAKQRKAARSFAGDAEQLPIAIRRKINIECMISHLLVHPYVRNLQDDDGQDVSPEEFVQMLRDPDYAALALACFQAASTVGAARAADLEDAQGN